MRRRVFAVLSLVIVTIALAACGSCEGGTSGQRLRLATTTSVKDSGLLEPLLAAFKEQSGYDVETMAVGSGRSLAALHEGGADVAITHAPDAEQHAVSQGEAARRTPFMKNAFVIVGPKKAAAVVGGATSVRDALQRIAKSGKKFVSRGDDSGTHQRETELWKAAGIAADADFIIRAEAGMAATLERADKESAFALSDRGTFLARRDDLDLVIVFQGDAALENIYAVLEPKPRDGIDEKGAELFAAFLRSPRAREIIGSFGVEKVGEPLFTPTD
ncbi:MAG TPA: substrate-binding domain-containing protein [Polyangiaceae bacterium]|jgi:tungstate transport system substrate-binding protein|nr:substrate-binding domain-containing protein [Polyangiaceae bacterium]